MTSSWVASYLVFQVFQHSCPVYVPSVTCSWMGWSTAVWMLYFLIPRKLLENHTSFSFSSERGGCWTTPTGRDMAWWRHPMETFSAFLAFCAGNTPVTGEFPKQMPVTRSFDVFVNRRLNKRLSKQSWGWWFEKPSHSLWRHCGVKDDDVMT